MSIVSEYWAHFHTKNIRRCTQYSASEVHVVGYDVFIKLKIVCI
jgi:hypothetical protein